MTRLRVVLAATVLLSCIVSNSMGRPVLEPRDSMQQTSLQQLHGRRLLSGFEPADAGRMQQQRALLAGAGSQTATAGPSTAAAGYKQLSWQLQQQNPVTEDPDGIHDVVLRPGQLSKVYLTSHVHPTRKVLSSQKAQATQGCTGRFC